MAEKKEATVKFLSLFRLTCIAGSHSYHRRCPLSESQSCQSREWNCQRGEWEAGTEAAQRSPDIGGSPPPGSSSSSARATFGSSRTGNTTLLPRNHTLGGLLDRATFAGGRLRDNFHSPFPNSIQMIKFSLQAA